MARYARLTRWLAPLLATALLACASGGPDEAAPRLFLVGDAIMGRAALEDHPQLGWGKALKTRLKDTIQLEDHTRAGHSTRSYLAEGHWQAVRERLTPGDFVVIALGHNDQLAPDESRRTQPWSEYRVNLEQMVDQSLAAGAIPMLVTPLYRRAFREDGQPRATLGDYPEVVRAVAIERGVALVDMNRLSRRLLLRLGAEGSSDLYMQIPPKRYPALPEGADDNAHLQRRGARLMAGLFARSVAQQELALASHLKP